MMRIRGNKSMDKLRSRRRKRAMFHEELQEVIYGVSYSVGFQQFSECVNITMHML